MKKDKKNHKNILLKIPDVKELRYIAQKFYIWGFTFAGNFKNSSKVKEKTIIDEFEWDWKNERNKTWGLEGDTEGVYRLLNNYSKNHEIEIKKGSEWNLIEIIDKTSNTIRTVPDTLEVVIDPNGNSIFIEDYQIEGKKLYGIIHKEDGTTMFLYKNPGEVDETKKRVEESNIFLIILDEGYLNDLECLEQFFYAKFLKKPMVILEENNILKKFPNLTFGCDILLKLPLTKNSHVPEELTKKIKTALKNRETEVSRKKK